MYNTICTRIQRMALQLCCGASLALPACTTATPPPPAEEPPLMAGEARFAPMSKSEQKALQTALAPFLRSSAPIELWYLGHKNWQDNGTFTWCISPAESEGTWTQLGTIPVQDLQQLAENTTGVECGDTLDYWLTFELRSGNHSLRVSACPAEEFGVNIASCSPVRAREFHKLLWQLMDKKYAIQKRFDKTVQE